MARVALVVALVLLCGLGALAQSPDPVITAQLPKPGSSHNYVGIGGETVNPADGSLSFELSIQPPSGRQLSMPFGVNYSSSEQFNLKAQNDGHLVWDKDPRIPTPFQLGGWSYDLPRIIAKASSTKYETGGPPRWPQNTPLYCDYVLSSEFRGFDGAWQALGYQGQWPDPSFPSSCTWNNYPNAYGGSSVHGWGVVAPTATPYKPSASQPPLDVTDSSGTTYHFQTGPYVDPGAGSLPVTWGLLPQSITDRNGNKISLRDNQADPITAAGGANAYIDTLGRQVLAWPSLGHNGDQLSISGLGGNITLHWVTVNVSFPETGYMAYGGGSPCTLTPNQTPTAQLSAISEIDLPNGQKYTLSYSAPYGRVSRITFPGGGYVRYVWGLNSSSASTAQFWTPQAGLGESCYLVFDQPAIKDRYVSYDGVTEALHQSFAYSTTWITPTPTSDYWWTGKGTTVNTTDLVTNQTTVTSYSYLPFQAEGASLYSTWYGVRSSVPVESKIVYSDGIGHTLKTVNKTWKNPFALIGEQTILDNGQGTITLRCYDAHEQLTNTYEYGFQSEGAKPADPACYTSAFQAGSGSRGDPGLNNSAAGPLKRQTVVAYHNFVGIAPSTHIVNAPDSATVADGSGSTAQQTTIAYTNSTVASGATTGIMTPATQRGNVASVSRLIGGSSFATTTYTYFDTGQVLSMTDPCGNAPCSDMAGTSHTTTYSYTDSYSSGTPPGSTNAYLTRITDALGHFSTYKYSYSDGQLTSSTDQNSQTAQYKYDIQPSGCSFLDHLDRLGEIDYPDGGTATYCYNDAPPSPSVTQTKLIDTNPLAQLTTTTLMDGFGHVTHIQLTGDLEGTDVTDTTYDGSGRVRTVSNPHRAGAAPTDGTTTYDYDALGRTTKVTRPDSSTVLTTYTGRATDVMDEGNGTRRVERVSQIDGLGRRASVCEVTGSTQLGIGGTPTACGQDIAKIGFMTVYSYDMLENLLTVTQGGLGSRTFAYDSLSRLRCAANPEVSPAVANPVCPNPDNGSYTAGTTRYNYDGNGNLASKVSPKQNQLNTAVTVTASYQYDALNRTLGISYNDGSTPSVANVYDQSSETGTANIIGRRTYASVSSGTTVVDKRSLVTYDPMGRLQLEYQCAPDFCAQDRYNINYTYNQIGNEKTVTAGFPGAGSQTQTNFYTPADRLKKVSTTLAQFAILDNILYSPSGAPASASVGPSMAESWAYNKRGWVTSIAAAGPGGGGLQNFYTTSPGYASNGDVTSLNDSVSGNWLNSYDDFNRLTSAVAANVAKGCSFAYDRYGNRWQESPSGGSCNSRPLSFNANNHVMGYTYDAAGNELGDGTHTYTYDAENRIRTVDGSISYVYDADGRRVAKKNGSAFTVDYILDQSGSELAQLDGGGTLIRGEIYADGRHVGTYTNQGLYFTFTDHLGTERIRRNADGSALESCTNLPFGDGQVCSGTDVSALHFTGKERDSESGLDNFGARYDASSMGRFMTPDPLPWVDWQHGNKEERQHFADFISNPQNFNMYAYVDNNPTSKTDPTGMEGCKAGDKTFSTCTIKIVYDPKTSHGTLTVLGQNKGDKDPTVLLTSSVVVGGDGHVTPTGTFTATVWEKDHVSTKYGNSANTPWSKTVMGGNAFGPYQLHMKELDSRGIYIHGTMGPGWSPVTWGNSIFLSPTSHGCVRMCNRDDNALHDMMPNPSGNKVIISTQEPED